MSLDYRLPHLALDSAVITESVLDRMRRMRGIVYYLCLNAAMLVDASVVHRLGTKISVVQMCLIRGIGVGLLVLVLSRGRGLSVFRTQMPLVQIGRGCLNLVSFWAIFYALAHLLLADASAINYSRALFMTLLGVWWFGEKVGRWRWATIILSYVGALVIVSPGFSQWNPVYLVALAGAALNAAAMAGTKRLTETDGAHTTLAYTSAVALVLSLPALWENWPWHDPLFLVLAVSGAATVHFGQQAMRYADMSLLAPYDYLRLPLVILVGFVVFHEVPGIATWGGAALIILSGVLLWVRETKRVLVPNPAVASDSAPRL